MTTIVCPAWLLIAFGLVAALPATLGLWVALAPGSDNVHGPRYVLWKAGLLSFNADVVYQAMVADHDREALVLGLSVGELQERFDHLRARAGATADYQQQFSDRLYLDHDILWLGDSPWLVILKNGRAAELLVMKG